MTYRTLTGKTVTLGDELGKGGAAKVYLNQLNKDQAIKIFHPEILIKDPGIDIRLRKLVEIGKQLQLQIEYKGNSTNWIKPLGSFPQDLVFDIKGKTVGFIMPTMKDGIDLTNIVFARDNSAFYKIRDKPHYDFWLNNFIYQPGSLRNRFVLCYYIAQAFAKLYNLKDPYGNKIDLQLCNFDIKPANIMVSPVSHGNEHHVMPFLLDLDNLTLQNKSGRLAPKHPQFTPEYKAPEGHLDHYYDYFSIAVIFYQLILDIHPFEGLQGKTRFTDGTTRDFFMEKQCFPWGKNGKFLEISEKHYNFSRLPDYLRNLFILAFDGNIRHTRPDMQSWCNALFTIVQDKSINFGKLFTF
jgi:DNA-binding helix-hairpin-helix protein with protein kinase domain